MGGGFFCRWTLFSFAEFAPCRRDFLCLRKYGGWYFAPCEVRPGALPLGPARRPGPLDPLMGFAPVRAGDCHYPLNHPMQ